MINIYTDMGGKLCKQEVALDAPIPQGAVWIDLCEPTADEERYVEQRLDVNIPTRAEMDKIEVMSPFYREGNANYMTITVLDKSSQDEHPDSTAVTFVLTAAHIITIRYSTPWSLINFIARTTKRAQGCNTPEAILNGVLEAFINKTADVLESVGNELDALLKTVFEKSTKQEIISSKRYNSVIRKIGQTGNLISKNRESLVSMNRLLIYFGQIDDSLSPYSKREHKLKFKHLAREVHSLEEYGNFLSQEIVLC